MKLKIDETHDPSLKSWVESANDPSADFPIQNLPLGVFRRRGAEETAGVGVAIGDRILDVSECREGGVFKGPAFTAALACGVASLNPLMGLSGEYRAALRKRLSELLREGPPGDGRARQVVERALIPMSAAELLLPVEIGDYTDFYASVHHATNVGRMFRPENPLLPNYKYVPIAYHGRASSIRVSGEPVRRPRGQTRSDGSEAPVFAPTKLLDYELELGFFIGPGNPLGAPIPVQSAAEHLFGCCIVNDWSARDIQSWEYQPLGPFLSKSFMTTISPWVVTAEALEPFRIPACARPGGDPAPLGYLSSEEDVARGGIDVTLEVYLSTAAMREAGVAPFRLSRGGFVEMYWTPAQMIAHHTSNGCNLRPGDLLASGTVSGRDKDSLGCLLELTRRGTEPIRLPTGEERRFLQDGDEVVMRGFCEREGFARIGFGECRGAVAV
ncbi:MAG: fumarylacetoacetase [Candidatus Krumholzibacteriota bacterium]|nr:fumarylacetoacetase [Candidatus Krumholzibacteriota bacterium]